MQPWQEVLAQQVQRRELDLDDFLTHKGGWETAADLRPFENILSFTYDGGFPRALLAGSCVAP